MRLKDISLLEYIRLAILQLARLGAFRGVEKSDEVKVRTRKSAAIVTALFLMLCYVSDQQPYILSSFSAVMSMPDFLRSSLCLSYSFESASCFTSLVP